MLLLTEQDHYPCIEPSVSILQFAEYSCTIDVALQLYDGVWYIIKLLYEKYDRKFQWLNSAFK